MKVIFSILLLMASLQSCWAASDSGLKRVALNSFVENANQEDRYLSPDEAFKLNIRRQDANTLIASFSISPAHYLYRDRIHFKVSDGSVPAITMPVGESKDDPNFGQVYVFHDNLSAVIKLENSQMQPLNLQVSYQGCSEKGLCYSPIQKSFDVSDIK